MQSRGSAGEFERQMLQKLCLTQSIFILSRNFGVSVWWRIKIRVLCAKSLQPDVAADGGASTDSQGASSRMSTCCGCISARYSNPLSTPSILWRSWLLISHEPHILPSFVFSAAAVNCHPVSQAAPDSLELIDPGLNAVKLPSACPENPSRCRMCPKSPHPCDSCETWSMQQHHVCRIHTGNQISMPSP